MMKKNKNLEQYSSSKVRELLQKRDPVKTARTRKRMLIAARMEDILIELDWKKKDLADKLGKNPSEVTKWLSGTHNFTIDILSDIELITGKAIIPILEKQAPRLVWNVVVKQAVNPQTEEYLPPEDVLNLKTLKSISSKKVVHYA